MPQSYDIYNNKGIVFQYTIQIRIQGGIIAAKGFSSIFMVQSVAAVSKTGKIKRDQQKTFDSESGNQSSNGSFAKVLENAKREAQNAPMDCHTTTYGRDSRIQTFFYQPREYRF